MTKNQKVHPEKDAKKNIIWLKWIVLVSSILIIVGGLISLL